MGMKGHPESNRGGGGGSGVGWMKKKKLAVLTVVIFVGLMGVMAVQKVKDRRLFNHVIKDKDHQIFTLQLLLQKERQYAKENKKRNQDLNAKLYSLETQKIELSKKIMEMRSIIGSLRDEQRVLEIAIDEKQNQIKHKESEIQDLKSNLQTPPKIWSVSSDDPSNGTVNLTDVKVQNPKDDKLAGSKDHKDDAKIEMHNVAYGQNDVQNGHGVSQRDNSFVTKTNGQDEKSQLKANSDDGPTEVTPFRSRNHSTDEVHHEANKTRSEANTVDEDEAETETEAETEADLDSSKNVSEADQDYKEETED